MTEQATYKQLQLEADANCERDSAAIQPAGIARMLRRSASTVIKGRHCYLSDYAFQFGTDKTVGLPPEIGHPGKLRSIGFKTPAILTTVHGIPLTAATRPSARIPRR